MMFFLFIMNLNLLLAPLIAINQEIYALLSRKSSSWFPREEAKIKKWEFQKKF